MAKAIENVLNNCDNARMQERVRPTIFDVASRAGVSTATVSRVLSQPGIVRPEKRARVNAAILALGYVRDGTARALVSGSTGAVGVIVPTLDNAIFSRAIQTLQLRLAEAGYRLIVASHEYSATTEIVAARSLIEHGIDAIVLVGIDHAPELWSLVDNSPIPVVLTWSIADGRDCVGFDNRRAGRIAAEHLLSLGHRTFGIISGILQHNDRASARIAGVRDALADAGLGIPDWRISQQSFTLAGGRAGLTALLSLDEPPTAVIGGNDLLAAGALFEAQARRIRVPRQLSIVGMDNLELSQHVTPALTTVNLPTAALGRRAAELVLARLEGTGKPRAIELPIDLVVRESTARAPKAHQP
jgi:LacI family transcriptional regulator